MKGNKLNGILWILISIFFLGVLIRGLTGKNWHNFRFWTWGWNPKVMNNKIHINVNGKDKDTVEEPEFIPDDDYTIYTFDSDEISHFDVNIVSEELTVSPVPDSDQIKIMIKNNVDTRKYFKVYKNGNTLNVERKSTKLINIPGLNKTEIIIQVPDTLYSSASFNNVSGKTQIENLKARKLSANNVSGKIEIKNCEGKIKTGNVSGKIQIQQKQLKNDIDAESVSGKIEITLPKNADFTADFETVSGSVKTDFEKTGKKEGTISNGDRTYDLHMETVSGSIEVNAF